MDKFTIFAVVGIVLMGLGVLAQLGTSKAERFDKVQVDPKKKLRIRIGYILMFAGVVTIIIGAMLIKNHVI